MQNPRGHHTATGVFMFKRVLTLAFAITVLGGANLFAQQAKSWGWDAPLFFSPKPMDDIGLYYVRSLNDVGGLKAIWRQSGNLNLGLHAGVGNLDNAGNTIMLGGEFYKPLRSLAASTGLLMSGAVGFGGMFGDKYVAASIPVGVSVGLNLGNASTSILPYVHPRVSYDIVAIDDAFGNEHTETDFAFAADIGADVTLGDRFIVRGAWTLGDREAWGIGAALRIPRKVVVR